MAWYVSTASTFVCSSTPTPRHFRPATSSSVIVDSEGVLWVRMESPYLLRRRGGSFEQTYPPERLPPYSPAVERGATAIARGTLGGVLIAAPETPLRYSAGKFTPITSSGRALGLAISIAETTDGVVWIGMRDTGLISVRSGRWIAGGGLAGSEGECTAAGHG